MPARLNSCISVPKMTLKHSKTPPKSTVDPEEIARLESRCEEWWDPDGAFRALHKFNPTRLFWLRETLQAHFGQDTDPPLKGLRLLDMGCGGGLISEPLARLGAQVCGADASERNIQIARHHAKTQNLTIDYRHTTAEDLAATGEQFDAVLALEVVEHVADVEVFIKACGGLVRPGGLLFLATLNRTVASFALAIVGAEYILRWLPRGTHQWHKFITPEELQTTLTKAGLRTLHRTGIVYDPFGDQWHLSRSEAVNYMLCATNS